jgi:ubiquinone/menaquinone biosynthesis C-methylase UbiE
MQSLTSIIEIIMKDNFSTQAEQYAKFRPTYPDDLYQFLLSLVETKNVAWDCGTGNGQVAKELSKYFKKVYATDISEEQIKNAVRRDNIFYKVEAAEKTSFPEKSFDLITVAQAIHWFDFGLFYKEAERTIKPGGILAVIGYGLLGTDENVDKIINRFYYEIIGPYWDKERKYVDENYRTIPFPFKEIETPQLYNIYEWTLEQLVGYLDTWSAVQHYIKVNKQDPVKLVYKDLKDAWMTRSTKTVRFPILLRIGKL